MSLLLALTMGIVPPATSTAVRMADDATVSKRCTVSSTPVAGDERIARVTDHLQP